MSKITKSEPLVTRATIVTAATAILGLIVALGIPVSNETKAAILGAVAALAPLVVAAITRHKVSPTDA